jgi:hypothetical protein
MSTATETTKLDPVEEWQLGSISRIRLKISQFEAYIPNSHSRAPESPSLLEANVSRKNQG